MSFFDSITEKLNHTFSKLLNRGRLTELEVNEALREIRIILLEADVNFSVVKQLIASIKEKALGERVLESLTPGQQMIKIVNEELIEVMGGKNSELLVSPKGPTTIMICGLQGSGKTTMSSKLALRLKKSNKKVLLVALDVYRPAAIDQLKTLAKSIDIEVFERGDSKPVKTAIEAVKYANKNSFDYIILDTAGRLHVDEKMMNELKEIKKNINPTETLFVVDSMTGQDAINTSKEFNDKLEITGVVLTKLDGDTKGGASISIRSVTGKPMKFSGTGEKLNDLEVFHPERMAARILGKGDVLTLIEKATENIKEKDLKRAQEAFAKNNFNLEDYLVQFESLNKMGNLKDLMGMVPGMGKFKSAISEIDEKKLLKQKAIIQSMTKEERLRPDIIKASRKKRIAAGSATTLQEVNSLLSQFEKMKVMMKQMKGAKKGFGMPKIPF